MSPPGKAGGVPGVLVVGADKSISTLSHASLKAFTAAPSPPASALQNLLAPSFMRSVCSLYPLSISSNASIIGLENSGATSSRASATPRNGVISDLAAPYPQRLKKLSSASIAPFSPSNESINEAMAIPAERAKVKIALLPPKCEAASSTSSSPKTASRATSATACNLVAISKMVGASATVSLVLVHHIIIPGGACTFLPSSSFDTSTY